MKIGFLGTGAMGGAILRGILKAGLFKPENVLIYSLKDRNRDGFEEMGCRICENAEELGLGADVLLIAVRPQDAEEALKAFNGSVSDKPVFTVMAGVSAERVNAMLGGKARVLRVMPNTPALSGCGVFALCDDCCLLSDERAYAEEFFRSIGTVEWMPERLIDSAAALSGSGPAFIAMFAEGLADGGVMEGIPREQAYRMAAQTLIGTGRMMLDGMLPETIKDLTASPAGSTIVGCREIERYAVRAAAIDAIHLSAEKNRTF